MAPSPSAQETTENAPPASGAPVVVALGDSVTFGYHLQSEVKYPTLLQRKMTDDGYPHQVVNAGRNGDTTTGGLRRVDRAMPPNTQVLIVALGGNDRRLGTLADVIESNLSQIIEHAQMRGVQVLLCDMGAGLDSILTRLAEKYHVIQVPSERTSVRGDPRLTQPDGHPNAAGSLVIAAGIWPYLEPLLKK